MAGDTFDAGTVYAEARLDRDEFQRELKQLRADMARFERETFRVQVGADQAPLDSGVSQARGKLRGLGQTRTEPKIGADTRTFMQRMFSVRATLKQVHEIVSTPLILVDIVQSMARVAKLKYELRDMTKQYVIDLVVYPQAFREVNQVADAMLSLKNVARTTIPVLFPLLGAAAGGATILASSLVGAGTAAGVFALAAIPALVGVVEKSKEIEEAQKAVTEAVTDAQRETALRNLEVALAAVSEKERQAVQDVNSIKQAWRDFQSAIQPAVFGVLNNSVGLISKMLPPLVPVVESVARVMNGWIDSMEAAIDRGGLARFTTWLAQDGVRALDNWGRALANFGSGTLNILMSSGDAARFFEGGILGASKSFLDWSQTLASNQQWQEFLLFTQQALPDVLFILGDLLRLLWEVHRVFAPITVAVLDFVAGFMRAHPELTRFLVVGFVVTQFFIGLIGIIAGVIIKVLLFAAIFGRIAGVMAVARTAGLLWGAVMAGQFAAILPLLRTLITQIFRLTAVGRLFALIASATQIWAGAQWLLNAAMSANPIGLIIIAVVALIAALVLLWHNSETFRTIVTNAWNAVRDAAIWAWENGIRPAIDWIVEAWNTLVGAAQTAVQWIVDAWNNVVTFFQNLPGMIADFFAALPGMIGHALGWLAGTLVRLAIDGWNGFTSGIITAWNATAQWFSELPGRIWGFLVGLGQWFAQTATDAWNGFTSGVTTAWNATAEWFAALPGRIWEFLVGLPETFSQAASDGWAGFTSGVTTAWEATSTWFTELPGRIGAFFTDAGNWLWQAGQDIWNGLVNGLSAAWSGVVTWWNELIDGFIQGFKDGMGIASPSTVFFEFGRWIIEGLLNGLIAFGQQVLDWILQWASWIVEAFQNGVNVVFTLWTDFWNGLHETARTLLDLINNAVQMALDWIEDTFGISMDWVRGAWDLFWEGLRATTDFVFNAIRTIVDFVWTVISGLFMAAQAALSGNWEAFWSILRATADFVWNSIRSAIDFVWGLIRAGFQAAVDFVVGLWSGFWNTLSTVASTVFEGIRSTIQTVIDGIVAAFDFVVRRVGEIWAGIKRLLAVPINFMINTVYNNGIVKAWNFVAPLLGISPIGTIDPIPEFAKGGPVRGDQIIRAGEKGDEFVLSNPAVQRLGGIQAVDRMHRALVREPLSVKQLNTGRYVEGADHTGPGISSSGFGGVKPHVARAGHYLKQRFGISSVGGVGQRANASDHPRGLALDFMTYNDRAKGDRLVNYLVPNAGHFAVKYIIWKQQINSGSGWRRMEDRGSITANHMDHPHVSFLDGPGGGGGFAGGGFVDALIEQVRALYDGVTAPIPGLLAGLVGAPPPRFREIPPAMAAKVIKDVGDHLFGIAGGTKTMSGPAPKTFDRGGRIDPGWNLIHNGTGQPELAGRLDQWASLIDSARVSPPGGETDEAALLVLARAVAREVANVRPLIGTMEVPTNELVSARDVADETLHRVRSVRRGGVHNGRPH